MTDAREIIAWGLLDHVEFEDGGHPGRSAYKCADAILSAIAEAGLVIVPRKELADTAAALREEDFPVIAGRIEALGGNPTQAERKDG